MICLLSNDDDWWLGLGSLSQLILNASQIITRVLNVPDTFTRLVADASPLTLKQTLSQSPISKHPYRPTFNHTRTLEPIFPHRLKIATMTTSATYNDVKVANGAVVHYVEAGSTSKPTLVLLHGFPSSSTQFRNLIPRLADSYHVYAPDLPGFGLTAVPANYTHSFANIATTIGQWLDELKITSFAVYIFDYGAPTALRLALERPQAIKAIISQNGNAYDEGLGKDFWGGLQQWWASGNGQDKDTRKAVSDMVLSIDGFKFQYLTGVPKENVAKVDPTTWLFDYLHNSATPEQKEVQLDLFFDYRTNVELYPRFQQYLRDSQPPLIAVWGKGDPCFVYPGAEAFKKDVKNAQVELLDGGHFLLETHVNEVSEKVKAFLRKVKF